MKLMIFIGVMIFSTIGGWLGAMMSNGNWFSVWSILLSAIGAFVGIWAGFKAAQYFD